MLSHQTQRRPCDGSLTSVVAPSYSMPALLGKDWGTGTVGTAATIARGVTGYAAFSGEIVQRNAVAYGGQIGVNVALP